MLTKPSNNIIKLSKKAEFNNAINSNSFKETRELFQEIYNIDQISNYYSNKMETKYS
jgi:hypothetical protein